MAVVTLAKTWANEITACADFDYLANGVEAMRLILSVAVAISWLTALPCQAAGTWTMVGDSSSCSVTLQPQAGTLIKLNRSNDGVVWLRFTVSDHSLPRDWYAPFAVITAERSFVGHGVTDASEITLPANIGLVVDLSHSNTLFVQIDDTGIGPFNTPALSSENRICVLGIPNLQ